MSEIDLYEETYAREDERHTRWRAMCAEVKLDHIQAVLPDGSFESVVDVGCGDGALLQACSSRGVGESLTGLEIARSAVDRVARREIPGVSEAVLFDGRSIPAADGAFDLAILSHVLEHAADPIALLSEAGRVARDVVFEVPLEATLLSHRRGYREAAAAIGHVHRFGLSRARALAQDAGLSIDAELVSARSRRMSMFWADTIGQRIKANLRWMAAGALAFTKPLGRRLLTYDYTCHCRDRTSV